MAQTRSTRVRRALASAATVTWQSLVLIVGAAVVLYVLGYLWAAVLPIVLALLFSTLVWPVARFLRAHRWPPALAAGVVTLAAVVVLAGVITLIVIPVINQAPQVASGLVNGVNEVEKWVQGPPLNLGEDKIGNLVQEGLNKLQDNLGSLASTVLGGVGAVGDGLLVGVLVIILIFFYLKDGPKFLPWLTRQTGAPAGVHVAEIGGRIYSTVGSFMRSQALVGLLDAVLIAVGLLIVGVPLVLPLSLFIFIGAFIPIIGAFVAGTFAVLITLVSNGLTAAIIVLVIIVVVMQLEGNVFAPIIQSRSQNLHPAVIILVVVVGFGVAGVIGALLAVPVTAMIAVIWRYLQERLEVQDAEADEVDDVREAAASGAAAGAAAGAASAVGDDGPTTG